MMRNLFEYTPIPREKKLRFSAHVPGMTDEQLSDDVRRMKLTIPQSAYNSEIKKAQEVKAENIDEKATQRVRRGENTTLF